jgi:hypothetical protein
MQIIIVKSVTEVITHTKFIYDNVYKIQSTVQNLFIQEEDRRLIILQICTITTKYCLYDAGKISKYK